MTFDNFEKITEQIVKDQKVAKDLTCHSNMGAIITNGTAILGLGDLEL